MTNEETNPPKKKVHWPGMPTPMTEAFGTLIFILPPLIGLLVVVSMVIRGTVLHWMSP